MPKQDKEVGHKYHNFAPQQAGNPLLEFTQIIADNRHKLWKLVAANCGNAIDFFSSICYTVFEVLNETV